MNKDKRMEEIEALADLIEADLPLFLLFHNDVLALAKQLYDAGFRKASDTVKAMQERLKQYIDVGHYRSPTEVCFSELDVANIIDKITKEMCDER